MALSCPACGHQLSEEQINIATDVGVCPGCNHVFSVSRALSGAPVAGAKGNLNPSATQVSDSFDIDQTPAGVTFENRGALGWTIRSTTRSAAAFFLVPFSCVWSGGSLGGIYGMQIANGEFSLILSLFGLPFLIGSIVLVSVSAMSVFGHLVVTYDGEGGSVFTGLGPVGWRRYFDWEDVSYIEETQHNNSVAIAMVGQTRTIFGSTLSADRRFYFRQALQVLVERRQERR